MFVLRTGKSFGKHIGNLLFGRNMLDCDGFVDDMGSEMVQTHGKVFSAWTSFVVCCDFNAALIVLEGSADNSWSRGIHLEVPRLEFVHKVYNRYNLAEGGR